jgi:uncharacterized delta-60 repeat protein
MKKITALFLFGVVFATASIAQPGSNDASFDTGTGFNNFVYSTSIQADEKIIMGGWFTDFNGTAMTRVARSNADGSVDASFDAGSGFNSTVRSTNIQADGKIIVGGSFTSFNGTTSNYLARLNTDGSLDATYNLGTGFNSTVRSTSIQADGKIIVVGNFTSFNGTTRARIARLNEDGSLDASFNIGSGFSGGMPISTSIQEDGKIIVAGNFTTFNGIAATRIARLNTDGSLDNSFTSGTGFNDEVRSTSIQADGKIIVGGDFTTFNGTATTRITRLNTDGSLDATFNIGTGFNVSVWSISIQEDGKIIVGGEFSNFNGTARNRIARLNTDGSLDTSFNPGSGFNTTVRSTSIQADGKIIVGGDFTSFNGSTRNRIARLFSCTPPTADAPSNVSACDSYTLPSLSVGNYYTAPNGGGTLLNAGDNITSTQTFYVYAANGSCTDENSFVITITTTPSNTVSILGNTLTADEIGATYQWIDCNNGNAAISGETNQSYEPSVGGNYAVEVTKDGCTSTSDCQSITILGVYEQTQINFSAYPNPTNGDLTIKLGNFVYSDITVIVSNSIGQLVMSKNYKSTNTLDFTMEGEPGIYFMEIRTGNKTVVLKIIKK